MWLALGDRILIEPAEGEAFEATVLIHHGWGRVRGEMIIGCRRDDGSTFSYGIWYDAPVTVINHEANR